MKKIFISVFLISALALLMGCTNQSQESQTPAVSEVGDQDSNDDNQEEQNETEEIQNNMLNIQVGDKSMTAVLSDNSSVAALKEKLANGPVTIDMRDYGGMEKVGGFGFDLPRNDTQITTQPGDLILYQGSAFVIYYAPNSWNFTKLGHIEGATRYQLLEFLGNGSVTVTLSLV